MYYNVIEISIIILIALNTSVNLDLVSFLFSLDSYPSSIFAMYQCDPDKNKKMLTKEDDIQAISHPGYSLDINKNMYSPDLGLLDWKPSNTDIKTTKRSC